MPELSPALISIAGGNEFLFARFYHIYEGVQLVLPESPLIVCCLTDSFRGVFKRGKDTEPKATIARKKYGILLQRRDCARCILKHEGLLACIRFPRISFSPKIFHGSVMPPSGGHTARCIVFAATCSVPSVQMLLHCRPASHISERG